MKRKLYKKLSELRILFLINFWKISNFFLKKDISKVKFIIEKENWAIKTVGTYISKSINRKFENFMSVSRNPEKFEDKIIHFGSHYLWLLKYKYLSRNNRYVVSFFHGNPNESISEKIVFENFINSVKYLDKIVVSNSIVYNRLIENGVDKKKLIKIPIGVDTKHFKPPNKLKRQKSRSFFKFKEDDIVIGSFQKDGQGWKDGILPKMIKGPDIFYKVVSDLSKDFNIKILLTGPARGYLKKKLDSNKISYIHSYLDDYSNLIDYYHALDFYLITSREEGGPMGLLESISSGVPVVSTNVGMASDFIKSKEIGIVVNTFDPKRISKKFKNFINESYSTNRKKNIKHVIMKADWNIVAKNHYEKVYKEMLR